MLSHFRQRIEIDMVNKINELMVNKNEDNQLEYLETVEKKTPKKEKKLRQKTQENL